MSDQLRNVSPKVVAHYIWGWINAKTNDSKFLSIWNSAVYKGILWYMNVRLNLSSVFQEDAYIFLMYIELLKL